MDGLGQIVELKIKDLGIVEALNLQLSPDGTKLIQIAGKNNAGKSTVLNAILYALRDGRVSPDNVIADGKDEAEIEIQTDAGFTIKKIIKENARGNRVIKLEVKENGVTIPSPQKFLDSRLSIFHDPQKIADKDTEEMFNFLKSSAGINFEKEDTEIKTLKEEQQFLRKTIKNFGEIIIPPKKEEVSLTDLYAKRQKGEQFNALQEKNFVERDKIARRIAVCKGQEIEKENDSARAKRRIQELKKLIEEEQERIASLALERAKKREEKLALEKLLDTVPKPLPLADFSGIDQQILAASEENLAARQYQEAIEKQKEKELLAGELKVSAARVIEIETQKEKILGAATLPCQKLMITKDRKVFYNGYNWDMTSLSDRLLAGMEICANLIPPGGIRYMSIQRGESILKDKRLIIAQKAKELDVVVFMEVATDEKRTGDGVFYIVEGELSHL